MKVLGIDLGKKRIGVALGDTENKIAVGLPTLQNDNNTWNNLKEIIVRENIQKLIIGLPKTMQGKSGEQVEYTYSWGVQAHEILGLNIEYVDERLSSKMARDGLSMVGNKLTKEDIDQASAVLILYSYLDSQKN